MQSSEYEDESFVIINDFSDYDNELWQCPNCGEVHKIDDIVNARKRRQRPEASFHSEEQQEVIANESSSSYSPSNNSGSTAQSPSPSLGSESILPPHIILRYAHSRALSSRSVSDFYKVLSEFYGIPVPVVETLPTLGYERGRKILGSYRENKIRFAASPTLHTILHVYFHYYSSFFANDNGGKNTTTRNHKSNTCKTVCDPTREEQQANDYANKCVIAFEQDYDYKQEFRHLALKYHPDRGGSPRIFELVKTAYDFLVDPAASLAEAYSPSKNTQDRPQQKPEHPSSSESSASPISQGKKSHRVTDIGLAVFHLTSFIVGIFGSILLTLVRVLLLPWNYWRRKTRSSSSSFSSLRASSLSYITKWFGTKRTAMHTIQLSILFADGLIIALLIQGVLVAHSFTQGSGYVTLQIFGALIGASTLVIGICKTLFR